MFEVVFYVVTHEKSGEKNNQNHPKNDTSYTYVDSRSVILKHNSSGHNLVK